MILFVCSQGKLRSRTAELLCLFGGVYARAAGTDEDAEASITDGQLRVADKVFCMERHHKAKIKDFQHFQAENTVSLDIPDEYGRLAPELITELIMKVRWHDSALAEAMAKGASVLANQPNYMTTLGTRSTQYVALNPAYQAMPSF